MFLNIISPSKKLNFASFVPENVQAQASIPVYSMQALELAQIMKKFNPKELASLLKISDKLSDLNYERYLNFSADEREQIMPSMYVFQGDTFIGLEPTTFNDHEQNYANESIRILSGLYGLLRPFDSIQAYRLEMGTKLENSQGSNLYHYWSDLLTKDLDRYIRERKIKNVINLASVEYSSVIKIKNLSVETITPTFKNLIGGVLKPCGMFTKRYRGMMAHYIVKNQIDSLDDLKKFNYADLQLYDEDKLIFVKEK